MENIYIFGLGEGKRYVDRCLLDGVNICGYIDNFKAEQTKHLDGIPVVCQNELQKDYDYIVITLMEYEDIRNSLIKDGVEKKKIISFFNFHDAMNEDNWKIIDSYKWRIELMWRHYISILKPFVENMEYEIYADSEFVKKECPQIVDAKSTAYILRKERKSLARFGDGEFEILCGRSRPLFQDVNEKLSIRLREVLNYQEEKLLIAIADNYGSLEKYTDDAARDIRMYMTKSVREEHMRLLHLNRQYYDAYISRPYMIYRDKEHAGERFDWVKAIWNDEDVLIVEGEHTRFGVGNDLLKNAKSVTRIITSDKNAFSKYQEIRDAAHKYGKNKLILAILGPTATVLAYDLAKENYWAIDIGQFDIEYEWFLRKVDKRCGLRYKNVSEVGRNEQIDSDVVDATMQHYFSEIAEKIV